MSGLPNLWRGRREPSRAMHLDVVGPRARGPEKRQNYDNSPGLFSRSPTSLGPTVGTRWARQCSPAPAAAPRPRVIPNRASRRRVPQLPLHPRTLPGVGCPSPPIPTLHRGRNAYLAVVMSTGNELHAAGDRQRGNSRVGPFVLLGPYESNASTPPPSGLLDGGPPPPPLAHTRTPFLDFLGHRRRSRRP